MTKNTRIIGWVAVTAFALTVVAANEALKRWGFITIPGGLTAPAGVYIAGLAFGLRDIIHETVGRRAVLTAIAIGGVLSYFIEPAFAWASATAFAMSELADFAVYEPLRRRQWTVAVIASNIVGSIVDSVLFLWLAFDSTGGWFGLTVGKAYMILPAIAAMWLLRRAVLRQPLHPAGT